MRQSTIESPDFSRIEARNMFIAEKQEDTVINRNNHGIRETQTYT